MWGELTTAPGSGIDTESDSDFLLVEHLADPPTQGRPSLRTVARPKQARSAETLYRILDAAEALIEEKGLAEPRFWFAGNAEDGEPHPPLPSDSSISAASQPPTGDTRGAGLAQRQYEEAWAKQAGFYSEPAQLAPDFVTHDDAAHCR